MKNWLKFYSSAKPHETWQKKILPLALIYRKTIDGCRMALNRCVWALGRFCVGTSTVKWMVNCRPPVAPLDSCHARTPCNGTRDEPVTNCNSLARVSDQYESTIWNSDWNSVRVRSCQNHWTCVVSGVPCLNLVRASQSVIVFLLKEEKT